MRSNKEQIKKQLKSESGQSVILISMVILSFMLFFNFAINTGVLITAKISVQAAADAAAYAGAATQARQLNAMSFLNYDMRRQYKKFLYRYAFMGNVAASNFPNESIGETAGHYGYPKFYYQNSDPSSKTLIPIKVPVVCIPITGSADQSDNCNTLNMPSTASQVNSFFPAGGLTQITQQLLQSVSQIGMMQEQQCGKTSAVNLFVLIQWLLRGDISPASIQSTIDQMSSGLSADEKTKVITRVNNLVVGMGLYPRNIITMMRIETLEKFLNDTAKKDVTKDTIEALEQASDAEMHERTSQAFRSALANLNNEVMPHKDVVMQELQNDHQITMEPVSASFNAYVQYMANPQQAGSQTICNSKIIPFKAKKVPVEMKRVPGPPVHYAVKVTAKAKLLFLPIKEGIELEAYASAKPFGSRIGPSNTSNPEYVETIVPTPINGVSLNDCGDNMVGCNVPNIKIAPGETYYSKKFLQALAAIGLEVQGDHKTFNFKGMPNGMAPQPYEVGHYNIIPPPKTSDAMKFEFIPYAKDENSKIYRFYAPVTTGGGDIQSKIGPILDEVFGITGVQGRDTFGSVNILDLRPVLQGQLVAYFNGALQAGGAQTENGETTTFAAITLPMAQPPAPEAPITPNPDHYWLTKPEEVLSSWGPQYSRNGPGNMSFKPRFGYSVKFVAMQNLLQDGMTESDGDQSKLSH